MQYIGLLMNGEQKPWKLLVQVGHAVHFLDPVVCGPYLSGRAFQFTIRIDLTRYANRFESICLVKKIGLSIL